MKVKFLVPMAGKDILYSPDEVVEVSRDFGERLIKGMIAEEIKEPKKVEKPKVVKKPKSKK